ncbi:3-deoxy-D-manno-octulosonic acid transferase [Paracrocinitomix mangrovi]|uniref:3-deoxy-D-manno-octulosonic acid transferase n=1 Tax=Paracrocinitomix mangrovi TaxID=2862509 RepID=UPI001C8DD179|nr:glycosyltransferase N-terminal domain-containing protein [Paracrocinitomix mangrovi]UKN03327.1 3-deoxy-D-manno-octulosonic acid transferase [Paracrocinitomix mangrovi]
MKLFYNLGVNMYTFAVRLASLWSPKAKKWVKGRKDVWEKLEKFNPSQMVYWFHCASLGEFEQGRPLMEAIKQNQNCQIVVTFFSPSGYEIRKNYEGADLVVYLPKDSSKNARRFIKCVQPKFVFFIKYEFWANYILTCKQEGIPVYSVAALFRKNQSFFTWYGGYMRKVLGAFNHIFVQNEHSQKLLSSIQIDSTVCGDTRYDRVMQNASKVQQYPKIEKYFGNEVFILGSIWSEDLDVVKSSLSNLTDQKVIIAPHEISDSFIRKIESEIKLDSVRYSQFVKDDFQGSPQLLIIDNIGMLMNLYQYGSIAYVGGAFKTGLHNILEPASFGLPVIFGNKFEKFPEAFSFIEAGIGFSVDDAASFENTFQKVKSLKEINGKVLSFMKENQGATEKILNKIIEEQS